MQPALAVAPALCLVSKSTLHLHHIAYVHHYHRPPAYTILMYLWPSLFEAHSRLPE